MNKKEIGVYKGSEPDKLTIRTFKILYRRLEEVFRGEEDFRYDPPQPMNRFWKRYTNTWKFKEDGWLVHKILVPDSSTQQGDGYHNITIVACTAKTDMGVREAIRRAKEVKTLLAKTHATITKETIVILSSDISFEYANRLRGSDTNEFQSDFRQVLIYSVKNALGVAKHVLNKLANFFGVRAKAILKLPNLKEGALKNLGYLFLKRAKKLSEHVLQLGKAFEQLKKSGKRAIRNMSWRLAWKARDVWGIHFWLNSEDLYDFEKVKETINRAAERQGVDLYEMERREVEIEVQKQVERQRECAYKCRGRDSDP